MAIQTRRGNYADYDASKMLPAEFATMLQNDPRALDGKALHVAFGPGVDKTLMTFEDAEAMIEDAAEEAAQEAITDAEAAATAAGNQAKLAESYAKGGTGTRTGEDTDNAKYYMERAATLSNADLVYNVYPTETAQGNPATFDDGADGIPVKDLKVSIVPNQDLHGYDKPWPGGGGKNLLPLTVENIKALNPSYTWSGNTATKNNVSFAVETDSAGNVVDIKVTASTAASSNTEFDLGKIIRETDTDYFISGCPSGGSTSTYRVIVRSYNGSTGVQTESETGNGKSMPSTSLPTADNFSVGIWIASGQTANHVFLPMVEVGSSKTTFAPYENLCPITGTDSVEVERMGKNLYIGSPSFDGYNNISTYQVASEKYNGHEVIYKSTQWSGAFTPVYLKAGMTYTFSAMVKLSSSANVFCYNKNNTSLGTVSVGTAWQKVSVTYTPSEDGEDKLRFECGTSGVTIYLSEYQIEEGSTATDYEPYHTPQTVTTDLGRTVYSGVLDVTTGVLTVDMASVDLGTLTWWVQGTGSDGGTVFSANDISRKNWAYGISSSMVVQNNTSWANTAINTISLGHGLIQIFVSSATLTDPDDFKTAMNGVQLVYELATPQTYTLTPQELLSVLGTNHISTDAESVDVVYRQDIGLILKRMSDSLLPYLPLTRDGIYDLKAEVTGGEKSLYWWTQAIPMMSSARPMQTPIADEPVEGLEEEPMDDIEENEEE